MTTRSAIQEVSQGVISVIPANGDRPQVTYRLAGESYLLLEYGEIVLDLTLRFRVHSLERAIRDLHLRGIIETAPGVRSLLIHYDSLQLRLAELVEVLVAIEADLPAADEMEVPSRVVRLPIAFHDKWTAEAVARYMESVRENAPYTPDNVAFIARCNGLAEMAEVEDYVLACEHMVVGLGDVYLGAPCAVPLDPRRRLIVPKYNPARTWTPEGAVGIGGAYLCIYPMESPGGYQLFGRTIPIWNTFQTNHNFTEAPWLLRVFDRISFERVDEDELEVLRAAMQQGDYEVAIDQGVFSLAEYLRFLDQVSEEAAAFKAAQGAAAIEATIGY